MHSCAHYLPFLFLSYRLSCLFKSTLRETLPRQTGKAIGKSIDDECLDKLRRTRAGVCAGG